MVLAIFRFIIIILSMLIWLLVYGASCIFRKHTVDTAMRLKRHWLKNIAYPVLNLHVIIQGRPLDKAAIYVCNHRSFLDPVVVLRYLDAFVIAKAEVAKYPIINKGAEITGVLYVNRESKDSRNEVREKMIETIKSGHNVLVFPEGTVGVLKGTLPFRSGTFFEAVENGIKVVPIALDFKDERDLWLKRNLLKQYLSQFSKWKTEVKLTFGPPLAAETGETLKEKAFDWVNNTIFEMQRDWSQIDYEKHKDHNMFFQYKDL